MWFNQIKGSFYTLFFILLNLVYLIIELSFNARVLDVSAGFSPSMDFGQLEIYGRTISASGATILAWRLLVPYQSSLNLIRLVIKFFIIAIIIFPLVFIGQKKLVDDLVEQSSSETRRSAEILSLVKYGIANGFVEIDELAMDELTLQTAEGKMFITLSGLLAYNSSNMREILEQKLDKVAGYAIATQQKNDSQRLYRNYRYARDQVLLEYREYLKLVEDFESEKSHSAQQAITLYEQAMNKALLNWLEYQQLIKQNKNLSRVEQEQINGLGLLLSVSQYRINSCSSQRCFDDGVEQLEFRLSQNLGFYSPLSDWCQEQQVEANKVLTCLRDTSIIEQAIIDARKKTLAVQAGLSRPYESKLEYLKSMDLRSSVFASLKQKDIEVDSGWVFNNHEKMLDDITSQFNQRYLKQYLSQTLERFGVEIQPRTELVDFNKIDMMQAYYRQALDIQTNDEPVSIEFNLQEFEDKYIAPLYFAKFNLLLNKLKAGEAWYEPEAPYEESGKNSLRNLLVPPVAIAFSLIFGLLNMINLLLNFVFLMLEEKLWIRWLGIVLLSGVVIMLPVKQDYHIYSQPAYLDLLQETEKNYGYLAHGLDWVAKTEPLIYPLGHVLRYNLLDGFKFD